jgi:hypothetical protein
MSFVRFEEQRVIALSFAEKRRSAKGSVAKILARFGPTFNIATLEDQDMHSLQEARTLGPLCGRSLILRHLKDIRGDGPTPKYESGGQEFESLRARHLRYWQTITFQIIANSPQTRRSN